jgi:hypothetical protein
MTLELIRPGRSARVVAVRFKGFGDGRADMFELQVLTILREKKSPDDFTIPGEGLLLSDRGADPLHTAVPDSSGLLLSIEDDVPYDAIQGRGWAHVTLVLDFVQPGEADEDALARFQTRASGAALDWQQHTQRQREGYAQGRREMRNGLQDGFGTGHPIRFV